MKRKIKKQRIQNKKARNGNKRVNKRKKISNTSIYPEETASTEFVYENGRCIGKIIQADLTNEPKYQFPKPIFGNGHKFIAYQSFIDWIKSLDHYSKKLTVLHFYFDENGKCFDVNGTSVLFEFLESLASKSTEERKKECATEIVMAAKNQGIDISNHNILFLKDNYAISYSKDIKSTGQMLCKNELIIPIMPNSEVFISKLDKCYFEADEVLEILNAGYKFMYYNNQI